MSTVIIIDVRRAAVGILTNPLVHGQLPATITGSLDPILAKDPSAWQNDECLIVARALEWALNPPNC